MKIAGGIGAGLLTLLFVAVAIVAGIGLIKMNAATAIPVPNIKIVVTPSPVSCSLIIAHSSRSD